MSVRANITSELAVAVGRIGAAHPGCGIQIEWREGDPEQTWHVLAIDGSNPAHYTVDDETGDIVADADASPDVIYGIDSNVIYVVSPYDTDAGAWAFAREEDAQAMAATYGNDAHVERVTVCDEQMAAKMIAEREADE